MDADLLVKNLQRALRTLDPDQGPVARRNARHRVFAVLAGTRKAVDLAYPAPVRKAKPRRTLTVQQRRRALIRDGYVIVTGLTLGVMAQAGVGIKGTPRGPTVNPYPAASWAPGWAVYWYQLGGATKVKQARRSTAMIKAAKAAILLDGLRQNSEVACPVH
jgi:hypothetical protein